MLSIQQLSLSYAPAAALARPLAWKLVVAQATWLLKAPSPKRDTKPLPWRNMLMPT